MYCDEFSENYVYEKNGEERKENYLREKKITNF